MNGWMTTLAIPALVVVVVIRRLRGEPLNARELLGPPVILTGIGAWSVAKEAGVLAGIDIGWLVGGSVLGFVLGALRGRAVTLFEREGVAWQRYTGRTFLVAVGGFVVMAGFGYLAARAGMHEDARPVTLSIGISYLGESAAVALRGLATGLPFAVQRAGR
jgi:hypothetical protein